MAPTVGPFVVFGIWMLIGVTTALAMGRRGHHPLMWGFLGACFGPFVIPLAVRSLRQHQDHLMEAVARGDIGSGWVDVLIGVDGSDEATQATRRAVELFGPSLRRVTLAAVLDYDSAQSRSGGYERTAALQNLERHRRALTEGGAVNPSVVLLSGQPARALQDHAVSNHYDVLVIGRRGSGASKALLGSVATRVSREANLPILLVGASRDDLTNRKTVEHPAASKNPDTVSSA